MHRRLTAAIVVLVALAAAGAVLGTQRQAGGDSDFARNVLPILSQRCFKCHGPDAPKVKSGLRMSGRDALLRGGDRGPAIVPGDPDKSLLIRAVRYADEELEMPPKQQLPPEEVAVLEAWVKAGAPWPAETAAAGGGATAAQPPPAAGAAAGASAGAPGGAKSADAGDDGGAVATDAAERGASPSHDDLQFFEQEVRPILADNCFECHGPTLAKVKGGLRMTGRAAFLQGGDGGPALVPGSLKSSRMLRAVRYSDAELRMPPKHRLTEAQVKSLERWVA
ncbi:MAG TPA: c-type cytochrome domain-containing protein, partial [Planctomycetota bacterium]|nr:c-type cytochrome domain-containing protein [Planctomycetota bacterium]